MHASPRIIRYESIEALPKPSIPKYEDFWAIMESVEELSTTQPFTKSREEYKSIQDTLKMVKEMNLTRGKSSERALSFEWTKHIQTHEDEMQYSETDFDLEEPWDHISMMF